MHAYNHALQNTEKTVLRRGIVLSTNRSVTNRDPFQCSVCREKIEDGWNFCMTCGSKINNPLLSGARSNTSVFSSNVLNNDPIDSRSIQSSNSQRSLSSKSTLKSASDLAPYSKLTTSTERRKKSSRATPSHASAGGKKEENVRDSSDDATLDLSLHARKLIKESTAVLQSMEPIDVERIRRTDFLEAINAESLESSYEQLLAVHSTTGIKPSSINSTSLSVNHKSFQDNIFSPAGSKVSQNANKRDKESISFKQLSSMGYLDEIASVDVYYKKFVAREYELMNLNSSSTEEIVTNPIAPEDSEAIGMLWTDCSRFGANFTGKSTIDGDHGQVSDEIMSTLSVSAESESSSTIEQPQTTSLSTLPSNVDDLSLGQLAHTSHEPSAGAHNFSRNKTIDLDEGTGTALSVDPGGGVSMLWTNVLLLHREVHRHPNPAVTMGMEDDDAEDLNPVEELPKELTEEEKRVKMMEELMGHVVAFASTKGRTSPHSFSPTRMGSPGIRDALSPGAGNELEDEDPDSGQFPSYSIISRLFLAAVRDLRTSIQHHELRFKDDLLFQKQGLPILASSISELKATIAEAEGKDAEAKAVFDKFRVRSKSRRTIAAVAVADALQHSAAVTFSFTEQYNQAKAQFELKQSKDVGFVSATGRHIVSDERMDAIVREADDTLAKLGAKIQELQTEETDITIKLRSEEATSIMSVKQWRPKFAAWLQDAKILLSKYVFVRQSVAARMIQAAARKRLLMYFRKGFTFRRNRRGVIVLSSIHIKR